MRDGIGCLDKISEYELSLTKLDEAVRYGFFKKYKNFRKTFVGFAVTLLMLFVVLMVFTIFKSIKQKNLRLE